MTEQYSSPSQPPVPQALPLPTPSPKKKSLKLQLDPLSELTRIEAIPDGVFKLGQFNEKQVNGDVAKLRAAVAELQAVMGKIIAIYNGCDDC